MIFPRFADTAERPSGGLTVLAPVYNDWEAAGLFLRDLDAALTISGLSADVLLVDDDSTLPPALGWMGFTPSSFRSVEVLNLRSNLGHQRAIAIGLAFLDEHRDPEAVIVMDADGEDDPRDVPRLVEEMRRSGRRQIVFAERTRRLEGLRFRAGYWMYCLLHVLLTGVRVRVGNFSVIPRRLLRRIVCVSELWNHYAAAVFRSKIPYTSIPAVRARRLAGRSKMNWASLTIHGLSALAVHGELIGVRLILATMVLSAFLAVVGLAAAGAALGWMIPLFGFTLVLLVQVVGFASLLVFLVLQRRAQPAFLPMRDYRDFVDEIATIHRASGSSIAAVNEVIAEKLR